MEGSPTTRLDRGFRAFVEALASPCAPSTAGAGVGSRAATGGGLLALYRAQLLSRHVDLEARRLRREGHGHYTIGSAGHEANAAVAAALRPTDPAFLHYRSGAFFLRRAAQHNALHPDRPVDGVGAMLLGIVAARDEPIAGGRHKVFGHVDLAVLPQTSTIASHLPKAVGTAFALERRRRLGLAPRIPEDAVVVCSFGDASASHTVAAGALEAAGRAAYQRLPLPLLFVCEDNGLGISVRTPAGWLARTLGSRPMIRYVVADGGDPAGALGAARDLVADVRHRRQPALLHLRTVRLLGHAGSDVELAYRSPAAIRADEDADPLRRTAEALVATATLTPAEVLALYEEGRRDVAAASARARAAPKLASAAEVMAPIGVRTDAAAPPRAARAARLAFFGGALPEDGGPLDLASHVQSALGDLLVAVPELLVFGEDVAVKGGVYGVTRGLRRAAGVLRVFDTHLDETTILGTAIGAAHAGLIAVAEIQYLAYLVNALDQLRGEAATLPFLSNGQLTNGLVVRVASFPDPGGFGGHFHNDASVALLRDVPGLVVAAPSRGDDAAAVLRACVTAARRDGAVCVILEPTALYRVRDLHAPGDDRWASPYEPGATVPIGSGRTHGRGGHLTIVTVGVGVPLSLRAASHLAKEGIEARVLDLRWLAPLPERDLRREAEATGRVLVADPCRRTGGMAEGVLASLIDAGFDGIAARVAGEDSFVPLGPAAEHVVLREEAVLEAARALVARG